MTLSKIGFIAALALPLLTALPKTPRPAPAFTNKLTQYSYSQSVPAPGDNHSAVYISDVRAFGASLDGTSDDAAALNLALSSGGTVVIPAGQTARITHTLRIPAETNLLCQPGARIDFEPSAPISWANGNDRAVLFASSIGPETPILGPIAEGDSSFQSAAPPPQLTNGEWVVIREIDPAVGDVEYIDWAAIEGVNGDVVKVTRPFRMRFPNDKGHVLSFFPLSTPDHDSSLVDCTIYSSQSEVVTPGVSVTYSRNITVSDNTVNMANGQGLYAYEANHVGFFRNQVAGNGPTSPEFAESTDVVISANTFGLGQDATHTPSQSCADLDFGTGFFAFTNNRCIGALNIALEMLYHPHDGVVADNSFPNSIGFGDGLVALGAQNVSVVGNVFLGGTNATSWGIDLDACATCSPTIASKANVASGNLLPGFVHPMYLGSDDLALQVGDNSTLPSPPTTLGRSINPAGLAIATSLGLGTLQHPNIASSGSTSVTLTWSTASPLNTQVWYTKSDGTSLHYADWALKREHTAVLSGLAAGAAYSMQIESANYNNPDLWSRPFSVVMTLPVPQQP